MVASEAEGRAEALRRIAACHAAQAEELDLGGLQLTALDGELLAALCQLGWLRRLFLGPSAEAREKPQLAFIYGEKNSKVCNALGALPGALFDALTRLERLDLALNQLRGLPASIANLTALTSLDLAGNGIGAEGAQALKGLVNLTSLDLNGNEIGAEGAQALKGLVNLTSLNLDDNDIGAEGAQALKGLVNLTSLDLAGTTSGTKGRRRSRASSTSPASTWPTTSIGDEGAQALKGLINLTSLNLTITASGAGCKGLVNLPADLNANEIGDEEAHGASRASATLPASTWPDNDIGAEGAQALKGLVNLTSLDLRSNRHRAPRGRRRSQGLVNLTSLNLSGNKIGAEGAQALKGLVNLTSLDLSGNEHRGRGGAGAQGPRQPHQPQPVRQRHRGRGGAGAQGPRQPHQPRPGRQRHRGRGGAGAQGPRQPHQPRPARQQHRGRGGAGAQGPRQPHQPRPARQRHRGRGGAGAQGPRQPHQPRPAANGIGDISPLVSLRNLRKINLSGSRLDHDVPAFWMLPSLQEAILHDASLPGVPVEILSKNATPTTACTGCEHILQTSPATT